MHKLGATINVIAPPALMPEKLPVDDVQRFTSLQEGLDGADIVMTLRLQKERMENSLIESDNAYHHEFGVTHETLKYAKPDAFVMHPGPINRDVEISATLADDPDRSLILDQVRNGVYARMAILDVLCTTD